MPDRTLFLTLRTFSATGGIEKVSRVVGKALQELSEDHQKGGIEIMSMYDEPGDVDEKYFPAAIFEGFGRKKIRFVYSATCRGMGCKQVLLSHGNLLLPGFLIKLFSPKTKLILWAHGIEVWSEFPLWKRYMLEKCDLVIAVSNFTKARMMDVHKVDAKKIVVLNNCLDPFLPAPLGKEKNAGLLKRYGLTAANVVLLTLTRLSSKEQYKGYDNVLFAINALKEKYPFIKYLLVGKYDELEKKRVDLLVHELGLESHVIFTGFIPEDELAAHYNIADLYIMPSKKEGFGIVFIEAMYYGKPVIAGKKDGSADALENGKFGILVDPDDNKEITQAILTVISNKTDYIPNMQDVMDKFSYAVYKENLRKILEDRFLPWSTKR